MRESLLIRAEGTGWGVQFVVFALDDHRYGLPLPTVERIVRIVEITPLPKAPDIVLGVVNVQGRVIPVVNLRRRFRLPERELALADQLIIARTRERPFALVADSAHGVVECDERDISAPGRLVPGLEYLEGVAKTPDGLVLIHDLSRFLALEEEQLLERAMKNAR